MDAGHAVAQLHVGDISNASLLDTSHICGV
jgi:hypothetical protein